MRVESVARELTQEYLKECLDYNPDTGVFTWKERPMNHFCNESAFKRVNTKYSGKVAGSYIKDGYKIISICGVRYVDTLLSILYLHGGKYDRRRSLIPPIKHTSELIGAHKHNRGNFSSKYRGTGLGIFKTEIDAHNAYIAAREDDIKKRSIGRS